MDTHKFQFPRMEEEIRDKMSREALNLSAHVEQLEKLVEHQSALLAANSDRHATHEKAFAVLKQRMTELELRERTLSEKLPTVAPDPEEDGVELADTADHTDMCNLYSYCVETALRTSSVREALVCLALLSLMLLFQIFLASGFAEASIIMSVLRDEHTARERARSALRIATHSRRRA